MSRPLTVNALGTMLRCTATFGDRDPALVDRQALREPHFVGLAAGKTNPKRLKGLPCEHLAERIGIHGRALSGKGPRSRIDPIGLDRFPPDRGRRIGEEKILERHPLE